uniref:Uncharacterized protein n=1 Tax=Oryza brachyantha TaxID=4533 RepID=J3MYP4_ORYBR
MCSSLHLALSLRHSPLQLQQPLSLKNLLFLLPSISIDSASLLSTSHPCFCLLASLCVSSEIPRKHAASVQWL